MRTGFYLDGKKATRREVTQLVGEETLKQWLDEAKEAFFEEPGEAIEYFLGRKRLAIRFS